MQIETPLQMFERWLRAECACDMTVGHYCERCHETEVLRSLIIAASEARKELEEAILFIERCDDWTGDDPRLSRMQKVVDKLQMLIDVKVLDINGVEIKAGQRVIIHNDDMDLEAVVVKPFPYSPTKCKPGFWVDVEIGHCGAEGMPSYIIEVCNQHETEGEVHRA